MRRFLVPLSLILCSMVGFAQDNHDERIPTSTMSAEPQVIAPYGVASAEFVNTDFVLAEEVFYGPSEVEVEIRSGYQTTALFVNLASKVNTRVMVVVSNPELVVSNERLDSYPLYSGVQQTINMVAFAPHSGTITVLNEEGEVLAVIPYTVKLESEFRHSVNGSISTSGTASFSYTLSSTQGWGMGAGVGVDSDGNLSGSLSGSYSW